jgi:hypothetical protein
MIASRIDNHVGALGHVAVRTLCTDAVVVMVMMGRNVIGICLVTLKANAVPLYPQPTRMRLMTVAANHAFTMHPALQEGIIDIDFITNLSVRKIKALGDETGLVGVKKRLPVNVFAKLGAQGVTMCAGFNLRLGSRDTRPAHGRFAGGECPGTAVRH